MIIYNDTYLLTFVHFNNVINHISNQFPCFLSNFDKNRIKLFTSFEFIFYISMIKSIKIIKTIIIY
jgi:hypothetical protein